MKIFLKKENVAALLLVLVDMFILYRIGILITDLFLYIPLLLFANLLFADYQSQFPPNVLGMRGTGTKGWYKNTYIILSQKFFSWFMLIMFLVFYFISK